MNMKFFTTALMLIMFISVPQTIVHANEQAADAIIIDLLNSKGDKIGKVKFTQNSNKGVNIHVEASQLSPGIHGIHIHEFGKCEPPKFTTAGAHFNPDKKQHGFNNPKGYHSGDLPNLEVGKDGTVNANFTTEALTLEENQPHSIRKQGGTSIIIHEKADDYHTDPSGNSGGRIACGVIN